MLFTHTFAYSPVILADTMDDGWFGVVMLGYAMICGKRGRGLVRAGNRVEKPIAVALDVRATKNVNWERREGE